jgi:hypothetical protein
MVPPALILAAALISGSAVAVAARACHWQPLPLAAATAGTFVAVLGWRLLANLWSLNDDFMPAVSAGDILCLLAGGLPAALAAAAGGRLSRPYLVIATGAVTAFVVNVVIL